MPSDMEDAIEVVAVSLVEDIQELSEGVPTCVLIWVALTPQHDRSGLLAQDTQVSVAWPAAAVTDGADASGAATGSVRMARTGLVGMAADGMGESCSAATTCALVGRRLTFS